MKIGEIVTRVDKMVENDIEQEEKVRMLSVLDGLIWENVMGPHQDGETFSEYEWVNDREKTLLVPFPYDELYFHWLCCKIYLARREIDLYNNAAELYGKYYHDFAQWYNREHRDESGLRFKNYRLE